MSRAGQCDPTHSTRYLIAQFHRYNVLASLVGGSVYRYRSFVEILIILISSTDNDSQSTLLHILLSCMRDSVPHRNHFPYRLLSLQSSCICIFSFQVVSRGHNPTTRACSEEHRNRVRLILQHVRPPVSAIGLALQLISISVVVTSS
jgi:hypothetical protein